MRGLVSSLLGVFIFAGCSGNYSVEIIGKESGMGYRFNGNGSIEYVCRGERGSVVLGDYETKGFNSDILNDLDKCE